MHDGPPKALALEKLQCHREKKAMPLSEEEIRRFLNGRRNAILGINRRNGAP